MVAGAGGDGTYLWQVSDKSIAATRERQQGRRRPAPVAVAMSRDATYLASNRGGSVEFYNVPTRLHMLMEIELRDVETTLQHYVDRDISDVLRRLDRYSSAKAADLLEAGEIGTLPGNLRRFVSRFVKCLVSRKGYREGGWGLLIALCAGLYPLLAHLKARLEPERHRPGGGS